MFIIPFFLLLFNLQLKAADSFNDSMGMQSDVVTVRDLVDFLNNTDVKSVALSKKETAILLSSAALLSAFFSSQIGSCASLLINPNADVYSCCSVLIAGGASISIVLGTSLIESGAMDKIIDWCVGKKISWGRLLDEEASPYNIREVRSRLMLAESPLLKKLKPDQILLLVPCFDLFKLCTAKECFSETSTILATKFIRMVELSKEELIDELNDKEVQKEIAEICNERHFYQILLQHLPKDKKCRELEELISKK